MLEILMVASRVLVIILKAEILLIRSPTAVMILDPRRSLPSR